MRRPPSCLIFFLVLTLNPVTLAQVQGDTQPATKPVELSPQQKADITEIISEAKENGEITARRLRSNAAKFDEVLFAETPNDALEEKCVAGIEAALHDNAEFRLQAARQVVHLLTPEQRRYLKAAMAQPDSQGGILEIAEKVFHIKELDK
jgi:Spy/CpxP family protein refolding chaperone